MPAGWVAISFVNARGGMASAQISRLKRGTSMDALSAAIQAQDEGAFYALTTPAGGIGDTGPGRSQDVLLLLAEGDYIVLDFGGEQPTVHPFRVNGPGADGEVQMGEFAFLAPPLRAGRMTLKVTNIGEQPHEMLLGKLAPGVTLQQVLTYEEGDPTENGMVQLEGGLTSIEPGATAWLTPTFTSGTYGLVCFIPDPATGKPHTELGMALEVVIP
jgi:uncharacterized cupredoxin-like copper-binding protein